MSRRAARGGCQRALAGWHAVPCTWRGDLQFCTLVPCKAGTIGNLTNLQSQLLDSAARRPHKGEGAALQAAAAECWSCMTST